jgi:hypothetical protein
MAVGEVARFSEMEREIRYLLKKADYLFVITKYEEGRKLQPGRQDPIYNCYLAINALFGSIYEYAEALGRLQLFGAIVAQCPKPESGEAADLKSILPGNSENNGLTHVNSVAQASAGDRGQAWRAIDQDRTVDQQQSRFFNPG